MHVLIGARSVYSMGGMQRVVIDLANNLNRRGHTISVVGESTHESKTYYPLDAGINLINISLKFEKFNLKIIPDKIAFKILHHGTRVLPSLSKIRLYDDIRWKSENIYRIEAWRKLCLEIQPDIVIGVLPDTFTLLSLALLESEIPLVINNHNNPWKDYSKERYSSSPTDLINRKAAPELAAANTVLLEDYKSFFSKAVQQRTYVIPNAIQQIPEESQANPRYTKDTKTILATGRFVSVKDHKTLINAFAKLRNDFQDWQVKIFGKGELIKDLNKQIESLDLTNQVFLCKHTDKIFEEYRASHILAIPSYFEGFPMTLTEAMAHGLPCIGFNDASGVNSLIRHNKTGYLADGSNRVESLTHYLRKLMEDGNRREAMGKAGIEFAKQFEPKKVYDLWENTLQNIIQKPLHKT